MTGPEAPPFEDPLSSPALVPVFVSAGSNVEPVENLRMACRALQERFGPLMLSSVYRNAPEGFEGEDFLNLVIGFSTGEPPRAIVNELERLHQAAGRQRDAPAFGPRTLDLDLLIYGERIFEDPDLKVPRADVTRYSFVLGPLAELAPNLRHPVTGETIAELWARFDKTQHPIRRVPLSLL